MNKVGLNVMFYIQNTEQINPSFIVVCFSRGYDPERIPRRAESRF